MMVRQYIESGLIIFQFSLSKKYSCFCTGKAIFARVYVLV